MYQEPLSAMTIRLPTNVHEEMKRAARRRGVSAAQFVRDVIEKALFGASCKTADKTSLSTVIWISEYLMLFIDTNFSGVGLN